LQISSVAKKSGVLEDFIMCKTSFFGICGVNTQQLLSDLCPDAATVRRLLAVTTFLAGGSDAVVDQLLFARQ